MGFLNYRFDGKGIVCGYKNYKKFFMGFIVFIVWRAYLLDKNRLLSLFLSNNKRPVIHR